MFAGYLHRQGILVILYINDWLIHHPDCQVLLYVNYKQSQLLMLLEMGGFKLNAKKSELDLIQDIQFLGLCLHLDLGKALLPESKAREVVAGAYKLFSQSVLLFQQVSQFMVSLKWASDLGPIGSSTYETIIKTLSYFRSDKPVYTTTSSDQSVLAPTTLTGKTYHFSPLESLLKASCVICVTITTRNNKAIKSWIVPPRYWCRPLHQS